MRIDRHIFGAFVVILLIVMIGFVANLRFLFQMIGAQEQVDEEWMELNRMVDVQNVVTRISDRVTHQDFSGPNRDLKWDIDLLQDKMHKISSELNEETAHSPTSHHYEEEDHFEYFVSEMKHVLDQLPPDSSRIDSWAQDLDPGTRESLVRAERAGYQLQQADMAEMMAATRKAEHFRQGMIRWSLGIFFILVLVLAAFSLWFAWIFRRKTDTLIRDEQLLTVAVMAQSLAHEIRNPLGIIKSSVSVLKKKSESDAESRELLGYLVEETDRIDDLLRQLAHLSEGPALHQKENISGIVQAVCAFVQPHAQKAGVEIVYMDQAAAVQISCQAGQIKQLVINLVFNAIQASRPGQKVYVETFLEKNTYVLIVRDQGAGMDRKTMKRLFDPFFTTKSQGAGLGLVVVRKIVDWHKGRIAVNSVPGEGTTFEINLPGDESV